MLDNSVLHWVIETKNVTLNIIVLDQSPLQNRYQQTIKKKTQYSRMSLETFLSTPNLNLFDQEGLYCLYVFLRVPPINYLNALFQVPLSNM